MLTSSIRRAHDVRTEVGRLRKHSVLKSDWFSVKLVILTCRKNKYLIRMFIKEYRHGFRTLYFVGTKDDKYFNASF